MEADVHEVGKLSSTTEWMVSRT